jgi:ABC-type lipoprotein release transport system permease subunit
MALPVSYHWRNLFVRKSTTMLTVLVISAVVAVFAWMLSLTSAMTRSLTVSSDPRKIIVLKRGATAESNSAIPVDDYNRLAQLTDVAKDENGEPLLSPEALVQVQLPRLNDGGKTLANVAVRGVTEKAFLVHRNVKLTTGQMFSKGGLDVIVGRAAAKQFGGVGLGETIDLGYSNNRAFRIVGYFSANGGPMESEIWGYLPTLMNAYNRSLYSSVNLRLRDGGDAKTAIDQIMGPAIQLNAQTEPQYWTEQGRLIRVYLSIAYVLVAIMCAAAIFSIANTMFSAVAGRTREIAMLRTIGFTGRHVLAGFLLEAVMLALIGGAIGCLACALWLRLVGRTKDMFGASTFTTLAFEIRILPQTVLIALAAVALVGLIGALVPASRAARIGVVSALREA